MSLEPGTRLGPYEIAEPLGAGGMGEVYRAHDTRLGREVAIKVLPSELSGREDLRSRLRREARAISGLSHPNICTLHDLSTDGEVTFLVMELIQGEPLSETLKAGPLPIDEALRLAVQIASALSAAHQRGLIHRDLKPANVMLTRTGAKLLDFGLAKTLAEEASGTDSAEAPTLTAPLTVEGAVLGTPQYMAPEQIAGQAADTRTDIFTFGALLYEMVTGERAFKGSDRLELFQAILHEDPTPPHELVGRVSPPLERLILRCLKKDPEERWQCVPDLTDELRWIESTAPEGIGQVSEPSSEEKLRRRIAAGVVVAALAGALGALVGWHLLPASHRAPGSSGSDAGPTRLSLLLPDGALFLPSERSALAISPDGRRVVYSGGTLGDERLYSRSLDDESVRPLDGTEGGVGPFFSSDGERIGFFTRYTLRYVSARGGPAQEALFTPPVTRGAVWLENGDVLASPTKASPLVLFPVMTGSLFRQVTELDPSIGIGQSWPDLFDGGTKVLVTAIDPKSASYDEAKIVAIDLESGAQNVVLEGGSQARYLPTGHLVFIRKSTLYAAPFDVDSMRTTAAPSPVVKHVLSDPLSGVGHLAISKEGTLVYAQGGTVAGTRSSLVWIDPSGEETQIPSEPRPILTPHLSPDGERIVFSISAASDDLWVYELGRKAYRRLTFGGRNMSPIWTPDGSMVTYSSARGFPAIYSLAADGSGREETIARDETAALFPGSWSPDGQILALSRFGGLTGRGWDVYFLAKGETPQPFAATRFNESAPAFSPDGHWLAYCSDESGRWDVYVTSFPEAGRKVQVSAAGGSQPVWMPGGLELLYRVDNRLMTVELETEPTLQAGTPVEVLHDLPPFGDSAVPGAPFFDIAPDGTRFLVVRKQPLPGVDHLQVVLHWFRELERRVPTQRH